MLNVHPFKSFMVIQVPTVMRDTFFVIDKGAETLLNTEKQEFYSYRVYYTTIDWDDAVKYVHEHEKEQ